MSDVKKTSSIATIDFHVTSRCSQECPYCWGPLGVREVKRKEAMRIIDKVSRHGIRRIVFTGGDPLQRRDLGKLVKRAKLLGLEVAVSTTGDRLTRRFLRKYGRFIDLVSIPIDGSNEEVNSLTKERGHFSAVMEALRRLAEHPEIDVKICTALTRLNAHDLKNMLHLVQKLAETLPNRVFYNVFNTYPRAMKDVDWDVYLLTDDEFQDLRGQAREISGFVVNFLSRKVLDALYVLIFPNGHLYLPVGRDYVKLGRFLDIQDLDAALATAGFDSERHLLHSKGWSKAHPQSRAS